MKKLNNLNFLKAALIRALRTFAQTMVSMIAVGSAVKDIDWVNILSVSAVAALCSLLTSIATDLPEVNDPDGELIINTNNEEFDNYLFEIEDLDDLSNKNEVVLRVVKK